MSTPAHGSAILTESGGRLRVRLIREGTSKVGNRWTRPVLEQIARMSDGVPLNFYDMSQSGDKSIAAHWEQLRRMLPAAIQSMLPERLPSAQIGVIRHPEVVTESDGLASVYGNVELDPAAEGWFRRVLDRARAIGRALGVSIHAPTDITTARPTAEGGLEPQTVQRVVGYDVVHYPSAGGAFVPCLEALDLEEDGRMEWWKKLMRFIPPALRESIGDPPKADNVKALVEGGDEWLKKLCKGLNLPEQKDQLVPVLEALCSVPEPVDTSGTSAKPAPTPKPATGAPAPAASGGSGTGPAAGTAGGQPPGADPLTGRVDVLEGTVREALLETRRDLIESELAAAKLPEGLTKFARKNLTAMLESEKTAAGITAFNRTKIGEYIADLKRGVGAGQNAGGSLLEGQRPPLAPIFSAGLTSADKALAAFEALLEGQPSARVGDETIPAFRSIRDAYWQMTGDVRCDGLGFYRERNRFRGLLEGFDLSRVAMGSRYLALTEGIGVNAGAGIVTFPLILSEYMHKIAAKRYREQPLLWRMIATPETVTDFKNWRIQKFGEFGNLSAVAENAAYAELATATHYPSEEEITLKIAKNGGLVIVSWEAIVNDETRRFQEIPVKLARAAARTLNFAVWDLVMSNGVIYDTRALGEAANHKNLITTAISEANLKLMRKQMVQQKDINNREAGRFLPRHLYCGSAVYDSAYALIYSDKKPILSGTDSNQTAGTARSTTNENPNTPNVLRGDYGLQLHEVLLFDDNANPNQYVMTADPSEAEMIRVGFLNGQTEPELFVQDLDKVGSFFTNDQITYKVRHIYKAVVSEFRGFQCGRP